MALTDAQLEERRTGIGGSDVAVILGISPFKDPLTLYHEKRGELPKRDPVRNKEGLYWGSLLEEPICQAYLETVRRTNPNLKLVKQTKLFRSKEHPFMIANVDRRVLGAEKRLFVEAKSDAWGIGWGEEGSNEIPAYIMCQVQHYLKVLKADQFDLPVLIGNRDFRIFSIIPLPKIIDSIVEAETEFWDRVTHGVPPEPNWQADSVTRLMKDLYPGTNGSVIELPPIAMDLHSTKVDAQEQLKVYEGIVKGCKNRLAALMGEASAGVLPDGTCYTRKEQTRKGYTVDDTSFMVTRHVKKAPKLVEDAITGGTIILHKGTDNEEE